MVRFGYASWLPETKLVERFAQELKEGRLVGTRCLKCGRRYLPPREDCGCGSEDLEWFEAPRRGRLLAYSHVIFPPESMTKYAPYTVAVVELEDGLRLVGHITGMTPSNLRNGMPVEVVSQSLEEDRIVYKFRAVEPLAELP